MLSNAKLILAAVFGLLAVFVDFTSKLLSVVSDGLLIGVAALLVWQAFREVKKKPQ